MMMPSMAVQKLSFANAIVNSQPMSHIVPMPVSTRIMSFDAIEHPPFCRQKSGFAQAPPVPGEPLSRNTHERVVRYRVWNRLEVSVSPERDLEHALLFPLFLDLSGCEVLVVGGGSVAQRRIEGLLGTGARVRVVAPDVTPPVRALAEDGAISLELRPLRPEDVADAHLVLTATGIPEVDLAVAETARREHVLVNSADDLPGCDFHIPAVARRGEVQVAISTGGAAPALAARVRRRVEELLDTEAGP